MTPARQSFVGELVEGWGAIAGRVSKRTGLDVTIHAVQRWSKRVSDPLPVRRWGAGRPRVVANASEIDRWADRQWAAAPLPPSEESR